MTNTSHTIVSVKTHFHKKRGFSLLDVLLALGISAVMYANIAQLQNDMTNSLHAQATANQMITLSKASQSYITTNYKTLSALASSPLEVPITGNSNWQGIGDLTSTGLLPDTFTNNMPFGQKVHLVVRKINATSTIPEHLEGMLLTDGGAPMNDRLVGMAMAKLGGNGGGIMKTPPPGISKSNIQGSFASWSSPISNWSTGNITPSYGHVAMNLMTVGSPVSEWLNRYDTGNPEANRMHTNIDMNNYSLKNTNTISSQDNKDLYLQDKDHAGRVVTWNGGIACEGDATGCHLDISNDGGFYDNNDGWITFNGQYADQGLKLSGAGNNLDVQGQTISEQGIKVSDTMGVQWQSSPQVNGNAEASATYADGWVNINGASGFEGISTNIIQASEFLDKNNNNYYVIPSKLSHMHSISLSNTLGTNNLDPDGFPTLAMDRNATTDAGRGTYIPVAQQEHETAWTGGVHAKDVFADGGHIGAGYDQKLNAWMTPDGEIEAIRIGAGLRSAAGPYPGSWGGGIHTLDMYAEGAIGGGSNGTMNVAMSGQNHQGFLWASQYLQAPVFRPQYTAWENTSCGDIYVSRPDWGGHWKKAQIDAYDFHAAKGDIARDIHGNVMSCVNGIWKKAGYSKEEIYQMVKQIIYNGR